MKKSIFLSLIGFFILTTLFAQEVEDTCKIYKEIYLNKSFDTEPDTNVSAWKQLLPEQTTGIIFDLNPPYDPSADPPSIRVYRENDGQYQDTVIIVVENCDKYEIEYVDEMPEDISRPVYFFHGLGGASTTWGAVYNQHIEDYIYKPYRPFYNLTNSLTSQRSFLEASDQNHNSVLQNKILFETGDEFKYYDLPYAIAHSQGGLVGRDMDMKYQHGITDPTLKGQRTIYGLVTFGTPHNGARIGVSQDELDALGADLFEYFLKSEVAEVVGDLNLKWYLRPFIDPEQIISKAGPLIETITSQAIPFMMQQLSVGKRDPITREYAPGATYLTDTLNTLGNPCLEKALFYGVEDDPVVWRMVYFMLNKSEDHPSFGANHQDDTFAWNMEDLRLQYGAKANNAYNQWQRRKAAHDKCMNNCGWSSILWPGVGYLICYHTNCKPLKVIKDKHRLQYPVFRDAYNMFSKVNLAYKTTLGALETELYLDTVGWQYQAHLIDSIAIGGGQFHFYTHQLCIFSSTFDEFLYQNEPTYEPVVKQKYSSVPSDGTVLVPSQMYWPGVEPDHKNLLEAPEMGGVNHMQMRNCEATNVALRKIYDADGEHLPAFFKLRERQ